MSSTDEKRAADELRQIEDALIESILNCSESELREEMIARGEDPEKCVAEMDTLIAGAKTASAKRRFEQAKSELQNWRARDGKVVGFDREAARARLEKLRAKDPELSAKMMLAARKGKAISDDDMEGLLEDLARLERMETKDPEK